MIEVNEMSKLNKMFIVPLLFIVFSSSLAFAGDLFIMGQMAADGFRDGSRVQFNSTTGKVNAVFDMTRTQDDGMLKGTPEGIGHVDIAQQDINWMDYDTVKSYVDVNNFQQGVYTLVLVPKAIE
jgi:hypothetical protein